MNSNIHPELNNALRLLGLTTTGWANSLDKPNGDKGVSHTAVIRVAQGHDQTEWIREKIVELIRQAKQKFPSEFSDFQSKDERGSYAL